MFLKEAFNYSTEMDVSELRRLYYGRNNMFVYFSDSVFEDRSGRVNGRLVRPESTLIYDVTSVVARKVTTPHLYSHVIRVDKKGWVEDIRFYDRSSLDKVIKTLLSDKKFGDEASTIVNYVLERRRLTRPFDILWDITRRLSGNNDEKWNEILVNLGFSGFTDQTGSGLFGTTSPSSILLDQSKSTYLDSVEIQKNRRDERRRTRAGVFNKRASGNTKTKANRVAKGSRERKKQYD